MERGQRLKQLREKKNMSQTEASRFLGVSKQTLYKYENDVITNIPSNIIERMAKLYNTTPGFIMGWEDETPDAVDAYNNMKDRSKLMYEAYKQADPRTKALVDMALGLIRPDAVLPHSPEDNAQ